MTQLFTEDYMVNFLFDNTLGANPNREVARASRSGVENNPDRDGLATVWTPAAFDGLAHIRR